MIFQSLRWRERLFDQRVARRLPHLWVKSRTFFWAARARYVRRSDEMNRE